MHIAPIPAVLILFAFIGLALNMLVRYINSKS